MFSSICDKNTIWFVPWTFNRSVLCFISVKPHLNVIRSFRSRIDSIVNIYKYAHRLLTKCSFISKYSREQSEKPVWNDELKWVLSFDCYNANAKIKTLNSTTFYCQFLRISNLVQKTKILKIKYFSPDNNFEHPQKKQTIVWCTH